MREAEAWPVYEFGSPACAKVASVATPGAERSRSGRGAGAEPGPLTRALFAILV